MRKKIRLMIVLLCVICSSRVVGQGIHFTQFYNAPLMVNPANTALLSDDDFRIGLNYRNQWSALPVPFNTFSGFGDFKIGGNNPDKIRHNWLGLGFAYFSDKAGDGNLALSQIQGNIAFHLQMSDHMMLSAGGSAAYVQRSVNYDNLTFDAQWDGFVFNPRMANGEKVGIMKTNYSTVAAGLNLAFFPNELVYIKLGGSVANINQPVETFYATGKNQLAMRPTFYVDGSFKTGNTITLNPSIYATQQKGAYQVVAGSLVRARLTDRNDMPVQLILGLFSRLGDAFIGVAGLEFSDIQFMANYDMTMSGLAPYNASYGALELSLIYHRSYSKNRGMKSMLSCPRFF
ncbi:MAG: PorP/SprF family type IX secretion system membrane protein [Bacteroidota bacterium]